MSYSFTVTDATKDGVKAKIAEQMALVVQNQSNHSVDQAAAVAAGSAFVDVLGDVADGHEILVSMHGSVGWHQTQHDAAPRYTSAGVGVSAHIQKKKTEAPSV